MKRDGYIRKEERKKKKSAAEKEALRKAKDTSLLLLVVLFHSLDLLEVTNRRDKLDEVKTSESKSHKERKKGGWEDKWV